MQMAKSAHEAESRKVQRFYSFHKCQAKKAAATAVGFDFELKETQQSVIEMNWVISIAASCGIHWPSLNHASTMNGNVYMR